MLQTDIDSSLPVQEDAMAVEKLGPSVHLQFFPHSELPLHQALRFNRQFMFKPIEMDLSFGITVKMGRKIDSKKEQGVRWSRDEQVANNASLQIMDSIDKPNMFPDQTSSSPDNGYKIESSSNTIQQRKLEFIAFRSKVVYRSHAEFWLGRDGQVCF